MYLNFGEWLNLSIYVHLKIIIQIMKFVELKNMEKSLILRGGLHIRIRISIASGNSQLFPATPESLEPS